MSLTVLKNLLRSQGTDASVPSALLTMAESRLNPKAGSQNKQEQLVSMAVLGGQTEESLIRQLEIPSQPPGLTVHSAPWIEAEESGLLA